MRSFISNFNQWSLSTILGVGLQVAAVFMIYALFLEIAHPTIDLGGGLDTPSESRIIAERYIYANSPDAVFVGSSLGRRLAFYLSPKIGDLSISGGSPLTGTEIVLRSGNLPKLVLIETNMVQRPKDSSFINNLFASPSFELRRFLPFFRMEYRPSILLAYFAGEMHPRRSLSSLVQLLKGSPGAHVEPMVGDRRSQPNAGSPAPALSPMDPPAEDSTPEDPDPRLPAGLAVQLHDGAILNDTVRAGIKSSLDQLWTQIGQLRSHGTCVALVQLPVHPEVATSPLEEYKHTAVRTMLSGSGVYWIDFPSDGRFQTIDGVHLTDRSAKRVVAELSAYVGAEAEKSPLGKGC